MISAVIVDDEVHQQELLGGMISKHFPQMDVKSICSSVEEGIEKISQVRPELVFLDVIIPPKTGFDLLTAFDKIDFEIIFTTSYEQYALQALKLSAVDYLLKPFGMDELGAAIKKFEAGRELKQSLQHIQTLLHNINVNTSSSIKIALPVLKGFVFVEVGNIIRCKADNVYTTFYFADNTNKLISKPIKECEQLLSSYGFFRTHSSHLINMKYVKEYEKGDGGIIKMTDGSSVDLSRSRKDDFLALLNKI